MTNSTDRATVISGSVDLSKAISHLPAIDRAILGSILGGASSMEVDFLGIDLDMLIDSMKESIGSISKADVMASLDRLQTVVVEVPMEDDGMVMVTNILLVIGYTKVGDDVRSVVVVAPAHMEDIE